jgi:hypothetical protein
MQLMHSLLIHSRARGVALIVVRQDVNSTRAAAAILVSGGSSFPISCLPNEHSVSYYVFGIGSMAQRPNVSELRSS